MNYILKALPSIRLKKGYLLAGCKVGNDCEFGLEFYALKEGARDKYIPGKTGVHINPIRLSFDKDSSLVPFKEGQYIGDRISAQAFNTIPPLSEYLDVDLSEASVWESALLMELSANYINSIYSSRLIVDSTSLMLACEYLPEEDWSAFLSDPRIIPSIIIIPEKGAIMRYCTWSSWGGLMNHVLKAYYSNRTIHFERIGIETLFEYDCGLRF